MHHSAGRSLRLGSCPTTASSCQSLTSSAALGPLSVLMLSDYFLPSSGGVERVVFEVSRRLVREGHKVTVLTLQVRDAPEHETIEGIEVVRVAGFELTRLLGAQIAVSPHVWFALRKHLKTTRFDILHTHNIFFHVSLAAAVWASRLGVPLVTTAHVGSTHGLQGLVAKATLAYEKTVGRYVLNASQQVIAVSQAVAEHLRPMMGDSERLRVVPNGVDLQLFSPRRQGPQPQPHTVVFVGRLIFNKGPQALLDAVPQVLARFPDTRFLFLGDGPLRTDLERNARQLGVAANVEFRGQFEDVAAILGQGSVFCRPSLTEGLPLTALEAMACELPVVVTGVGGTAEVVADGISGYIVPPNSPSQIADRLCQLLGDSELRFKMGQHGREIAERFSWASVTERTLDVYREALVPKVTASPLLYRKRQRD
jgi:glycosyltransferase involved in cell wall biosynthesis